MTPSGRTPGTGSWVITSLRSDGSVDAVHEITGDLTEIGRCAEDISVPDDLQMADHHASLVYEDDEFYVADTGQGSGVWLRADASEGTGLEAEDRVWVGSQILVVEQRSQPAQ